MLANSSQITVLSIKIYDTYKYDTTVPRAPEEGENRLDGSLTCKQTHFSLTNASCYRPPSHLDWEEAPRGWSPVTQPHYPGALAVPVSSTKVFGYLRINRKLISKYKIERGAASRSRSHCNKSRFGKIAVILIFLLSVI